MNAFLESILSKFAWKTTILGICTLMVAIGSAGVALLDGNAATSPDWTTVSAAVTAGIGLVLARDAHK